MVVARMRILSVGIVVGAFFIMAGAASGEMVVRVGQGGVGVWPGEGDARCGMDGRSFHAVEGNCYYPVDFQRSPDHVEIARWDDGVMSTAWLIVEEVEREIQEIDFPDESYVHLSSEDLQLHYQQQAHIKPLLRRRGGEPRFTLPLGAPASPLPAGNYFGVPRVFNGEPKNAHTGTDYAIPTGTPVNAVADGEVLFSGEQFFAGKCVYLYHGNGLISMVFHLNETSVADGADVERGSKIAEVGSSGRSTGPHLHLGLRWHGARIDPAALLEDPSGLPKVEEH